MSDSVGSDTDVANLRREYAREELREDQVDADPINQFAVWFEQALSSEVMEPNAMSLATASKQGKPSARTVLLKGFDAQGFRFFTNYESRKGRELLENPHAALCFFWPELERQVRIEGNVSKISREESIAYFNERPRLSRLGALASDQSRTIASRKELEDRFKQLQKTYKNKSIPTPEYWGGFYLEPQAIEFWQGREGRLHDRLLYERNSGAWMLKRLAP